MALVASLAVAGMLPLSSGALALSDVGGSSAGQGTSAIRPVEKIMVGVAERVAKVVETRIEKIEREARRKATAAPRQVKAAQDPQTEPPLHGTDPHGQGSTAVVDLAPRSDRPLGADPAGQQSGEEAVVGRARGERTQNGTYHGHITIVALFGNEILGVDTAPGQKRAGPLDALQQGLLDPLCNGSSEQVCLSAVRADSETTASGSTNRFSTAHATLGGPTGIDAGVAESNGNIATDGACQTSHGDSSVADARIGGTAVATLAKSSTDSKACKGAAPEQGATSSVLGLGGTGVPLPAPGCADGTPDTVTGIPTVAPIICNAHDSDGAQAVAPYGVREALTVFALATPATSLVKATTSASESRAVAPPAQCSDGVDNDGDGVIDAADPGCHSDGDPRNSGSYNPNDDDESSPGAARKPQCSDNADNDGDGASDAADPGCHTDGNARNAASYDPNDDNEADRRGTADRREGDRAQCADNRDNDGDGTIDEADPGCHSDGDASNPASYVASDDSEAGEGAAPQGDRVDSGAGARGRLPFTGNEILELALIGTMLMALGLALRRRVVAS